MLPADRIAAILLAERLPLTAFIAGVTRDFHLAEDVFQEICVKAIARADEFESPEHVIHWARFSTPSRIAAAASVANMLLNYDGCVTKR